MTPQKQWFQSKTVWAFICALPPVITLFVDSFGTFLPPEWVSRLTACAVFFAGLGMLSARQAGVQAAVDVANHGQNALKDKDKA